MVPPYQEQSDQNPKMLREYYTKKSCSKATQTMLIRVHAYYSSSQGLSVLYHVLSILHFQLANSSKLQLCPDLHSGSDQFVSGTSINTASTIFRAFTVFSSFCSLDCARRHIHKPMLPVPCPARGGALQISSTELATAGGLVL